MSHLLHRIKDFPGIVILDSTSLQINSKEKDLWFIVSAYLKRWSTEEPIRFVEQIYDLENIRVLKYVRLQNMMALLLAVFYLVAGILDQTQKLTVIGKAGEADHPWQVEIDHSLFNLYICHTII